MLHFYNKTDYTSQKAVPLNNEPIQCKLTKCDEAGQDFDAMENKKQAAAEIKKLRDRGWHNESTKLRLEVTYNHRGSRRTIFIYSPSVYFLVSLKAEIVVNNREPLREKLGQLMKTLSVIFTVTRFTRSMHALTHLYSESVETQLQQEAFLRALLTTATFLHNYHQKALQDVYQAFVNE